MPVNLGDVRVDINDAALYDLLNSPDGPVGLLLAELSERVAFTARRIVHVRPGTPSSATTGRTSNARPPGFTRARIRPHLGWGATTGKIFGGANSVADPTIFLEKPAIQILLKPDGEHRFPFLTTALDELTL
jgi:hypothetical protein